MFDRDFVEEVRRRTLLSKLIGERVRLQKRGRSMTGLCPFHKEKSPSFHVNDERGFFHCFGCKASGDAISFLRELDGLEFNEAVEELARRSGLEVKHVENQEELQARNSKRKRREELLQVNQISAEYFVEQLTRHPLSKLALDELDRRGLHPKNLDADARKSLSDFYVGYAPAGWRNLTDYLKDRGINLSLAAELGLIIERSGGGYYDRFRHRLMFAVRDVQGYVVAFSGRILGTPAQELLRSSGVDASLFDGDASPAKYMNSPESVVYSKRDQAFGLYQAKSDVREKDFCAVVEGNFDVLSLHARGLRNVIAPLGTALTEEQCRLVKRFSPNLVLFFDGDTAGKKAISQSRAPVEQNAMNAKVAELPSGMDPDDLVRQEGIEGIERRWKRAIGLIEFELEQILESGFSSADALSRAKKVEEVADLLTTIRDQTQRLLLEQHVVLIASRLGFHDAKSFGELRRKLQIASKKGLDSERISSDSTSFGRSTADNKRPIDRLAASIFGMIIEYLSLLDDPEVLSALDCLQGSEAEALAQLLAYRRAGSDLEPLWQQEWPEELRSIAAAHLASPQCEDGEMARRVLLENCRRLHSRSHREHQQELIVQLTQAGRDGDEETEFELLRRSIAHARKQHGVKSKSE